MVPMITPDFTEAGLSEGVSEAKIIGVEQKVGKSSGNPYLNWKLDVNGYTLYHSTPIVGRGAGLFKQLVRAAVSPGYDGGSINTDQMIGKIIQVRLEKEQDGKYLRVAEVKAIEDSFDSFEQTGS